MVHLMGCSSSRLDSGLASRRAPIIETVAGVETVFSLNLIASLALLLANAAMA